MSYISNRVDVLQPILNIVNSTLMATRAVLEAFRPMSPQLDNLSETGELLRHGTTAHQPGTWPITPMTLGATVSAVWLLWTLSHIVYNLFLHPLRSFAGPITARASPWWQVYIEVWKKESMTEVLQRLHRQYGDVVRTAPNELHFASSKAYFDIYAPTSRWDKEETLYHSMAVDNTSFGFLKYQDAKQRKDVLQPLFSRRAVSSIQSLVQQKLDVFCEALSKHQRDGQTSNMYLGLRCLTVDTISAFCFGKSLDALSAPRFDAPIVKAMDYANPEFLPFKHLPSYRNLIWACPPSIAVRFLPDTSGFAQISNLTQPQVDAAINDPSSLQKYPHPTIYHRLLDSANQNGHPIPSREHLLQEAKNLIFAGTDTTGNTLYVGFWHLMRKANLQSQLRDEIRTVWPQVSAEAPSYETLSSLPLLTAIIKESLRLSSGVVSPLSRVVPPRGASIDGHLIPGNTVVGMSAVFMHYDPTVFPNPHRFNPDRWLDSSSTSSKELERHLVPFSRGPRSCLGINLAYCELFMTFAHVVRKFELRLDSASEQRLTKHVDEHGNLKWKDTFLPWYYGEQVQARCTPVDA